METEERLNLEEEDRTLGTMDIKKLYLINCLGLLLGTLSQVVVYFLEGTIIGRVMHPNTLGIIGLIAPLEMLEAGIGVAMGIGVGSMVALRLGEGKADQARKIHGQAFWFTFFIGCAVALLVGLNSVTVAGYLGTPPELLADTAYFIRIYMLSFPLGLVGLQFSSMLTVDGKAGLAGAIMTFASLSSLAFLFLNAYVLKWGILGVGIYYILGLGLYFIAIFYFLFDKKTIFRIYLSDMKFKVKDMLNALKIGTPYLAQQVAILLFTIVANQLLGDLGSGLHIATFTIINGYIFYIMAMVNQGMINAMQPIVGYNYGAKKYTRVVEIIKVSNIANFLMLLVPTVLMSIFATPMISIFTTDPELILLGAQGLRVAAIMSAFGMVPTMVSGYYQAIDRTMLSLFVGISRFSFIGIPLMYALSNFMGIKGIWYAFLGADIVSFILAMAIIYTEVKKLKAMSTADEEETDINIDVLEGESVLS